MKTIYVSLLLLMASLSSSEDQSLILTHSYPENRNFNKVKLTCLRHDSVTVFLNETRFLLNDTMDLQDVESIDVLDYKHLNGEITFIFGQKQEGLYSCLMGSKSSNHIALAGILLIATCQLPHCKKEVHGCFDQCVWSAQLHYMTITCINWYSKDM